LEKEDKKKNKEKEKEIIIKVEEKIEKSPIKQEPSPEDKKELDLMPSDSTISSKINTPNESEESKSKIPLPAGNPLAQVRGNICEAIKLKKKSG